MIANIYPMLDLLMKTVMPSILGSSYDSMMILWSGPISALAFVGFLASGEWTLLYLSAAIFGFSYGGITALFPALVGDFFGRIVVGAIVGFIFAAAGSPAAFGPLLAGYLYDLTGSYRIAFEFSAILSLIALTLVFFLRKPRQLTVASSDGFGAQAS